MGGYLGKRRINNAFCTTFWNFGVKILITFLLISQLLYKTQGCALDM